MKTLFIFADGSKISINDNDIEMSGVFVLEIMWKINRNYGKTKPTLVQILKFLRDFYGKFEVCN
jgi:hypothetical protein